MAEDDTSDRSVLLYLRPRGRSARVSNRARPGGNALARDGQTHGRSSVDGRLETRRFMLDGAELYYSWN